MFPPRYSCNNSLLRPYWVRYITQQNYLTKTDLDSYVFSVKSCLYVYPGCGDTTWYHHNPDGHKDGTFREKYGAIQGCFDEVVLPCNRLKSVVSLAQPDSDHIWEYRYFHGYSYNILNSKVEHSCSCISCCILLSKWYVPKFYQWNFEDDNFVEGQSTVKTTKIKSLENW